MKKGILFGIFGAFGMICGYLLCYFQIAKPERQAEAGPSSHLEFIETFPRKAMGLSEREYIGVGDAILLLEENDFPEAMTAIGGFDPEMESRLKGLALRQWYVFNHTEAWKWLEANWAFFDEDEVEVIICELLQDCYSVNPVFAFEKQKAQIERLRGYPRGCDSSEWMYHLGRFSTAPLLRLPELESLSDSLGYQGRSLSMFDSWNSGSQGNLRSFVRGIAQRNENEIEIIRGNLSETYPEALLALDRQLRLSEISKVSGADWEKLRAKYSEEKLPDYDDDAWQEFRDRSDEMYSVFQRWVKEDREAALKWFIFEAPPWAQDRRLVSVFQSELFRKKAGKTGRVRFDLDVVLPFLNELDTQGYETRNAWNLVISEGIFLGDPDPFFSGANQIDEDQREARRRELVKELAANADWDGRSWFVRRFSDYQRDLAQRLGIEKEVEKEINELNLSDLESFEKAIKETLK